MVAYTFTPLLEKDDIRILTLNPGSDSDPLTGSLNLRNGDEAYEAVSWTWGDADETSHISLHDGSSVPKTLAIKPNLEAALKSLRSHHADGLPRKLWIDAICVEQKNNVEKNKQVAMMALIYSQATGVCVWLGESDDDSVKAIEFTQEVLDIANFDELLQEDSTVVHWKALASLLSRPWFERRWIVQEIALARSAIIYCGNDSLTWQKFAIAVALFRSKHIQLSKLTKSAKEANNNPHAFGDINAMSAVRLVDTTASLYRRNETGDIQSRLLNLEALVVLLSDFKAREPHDVFYSVLALGSDTFNKTSLVQVPTRSGTRYNTPDPNAPPSPAAHVNGDPDDEFSRFLVPGSFTDDSLEDAQIITATWGYSQTEIVKKGIRNAVGRFRNSLDPKNTTIFKVDYNQEFFEVCKHFMKFAISKSESLDLLCRPWAPGAGDRPRKEQPLPTWIPTMDMAVHKTQVLKGKYGGSTKIRTNADPFVGMDPSQRPWYKASGLAATSDTWRFGTGDKNRSLFVRGFILGIIGEIADSAHFGNLPGSWRKLAMGPLENVSADDKEPGYDIFWKTLVADRATDGRNVPIYFSLAFSYALEDPDGCNIQKLVDAHSSSIVDEFARRVQAVIWKRRLFTLENEHKYLGTGRVIGLSPDRTTKGDIIAIIQGCSVPVVLHHVENTTTYTFIGEAYVHGYMDGEAITLQESIGSDATANVELKRQMRTREFELV